MDIAASVTLRCHLILVHTLKSMGWINKSIKNTLRKVVGIPIGDGSYRGAIWNDISREAAETRIPPIL